MREKVRADLAEQTRAMARFHVGSTDWTYDSDLRRSNLQLYEITYFMSISFLLAKLLWPFFHCPLNLNK